MVGFLGRGMAQGLCDLRLAGSQRLPLIKSLRSHLSGMVDPHQSARLLPLSFGEHFALRQRPEWPRVECAGAPKTLIALSISPKRYID